MSMRPNLKLLSARQPGRVYDLGQSPPPRESAYTGGARKTWCGTDSETPRRTKRSARSRCSSCRMCAALRVSTQGLRDITQAAAVVWTCHEGDGTLRPCPPLTQFVRPRRDDVSTTLASPATNGVPKAHPVGPGCASASSPCRTRGDHAPRAGCGSRELWPVASGWTILLRQVTQRERVLPDLAGNRPAARAESVAGTGQPVQQRDSRDAALCRRPRAGIGRADVGGPTART
jgi:hypothetical protein